RAERAQARHAEFRIAERNRFGRAPLLVEELFHVHKDHFGGEGRFAHRRQTDDAGKNRQVGGRQRVSSGTEGIERFAVAEKDGGLTFADDDLRAKPKIAGTIRGFAVDDLASGFVQKLYDINDAWHKTSSSELRGMRDECSNQD